MATNYTTNTASLKTSIADIHKLDAKIIDAKKIKLNGINIEDLLSSGVIIEDGREVKSKYDIWEHAAVENEDGSVTVKNLYIPDASGWIDDFADDMNYEGEWSFTMFRSKTRNVIDNNVYITDVEELNLDDLGNPDASFDTSKIVNGTKLFARVSPGGVGGGDEDMRPLPKMIFKSNLDNLKVAEEMFRTHQNDGQQEGHLEFISDLHNLVDGSFMFCNTVLEKFETKDGKSINLDNLENGSNMFCSSEVGSYFGSINLPKLKNGYRMFGKNGLTNFYNKITTIENWTGNLDSLENGEGMFRCSDGYDGFKIENFYSNLPKLKNGSSMSPCVFKFRGSLPSLINGYDMFKSRPEGGDAYKTQLDALSIVHIVDSLPDRTGLENIDSYDGEGYIDIGIGCSDSEEDKQLYAEEGDWNSFQEIIDEFDAKNWVVRFSFNGRPTTTYGMRNIEPVQETPMWCKLEEVIMPSDKNLARRTRYAYTSQDGTKFYNIHSYHVSNRENENYIQFNSLEDAITHWNLKEKE